MNTYSRGNEIFAAALIIVGVVGVVWSTYTPSVSIVSPVAALLIGFGLGIYSDKAK